MCVYLLLFMSLINGPALVNHEDPCKLLICNFTVAIIIRRFHGIKW